MMNLCSKCTALPKRDSLTRTRLALARWVRGCALVVLVLAANPAARADMELGREGLVGRHRLVDMHDSAGATCDIILPGRESLGETWLYVNAPIIFARNRTPAIDEQLVGWQATTSARDESTDAWHVVRQSDVAREMASDDLASYFHGQGWLAEFPLGRTSYSVTVEMFWYDPSNPNQIEGRVTYAIENYSIQLHFNGQDTYLRTASVCHSPL
jgi:hypothetical protein